MGKFFFKIMWLKRNEISMNILVLFVLLLFLTSCTKKNELKIAIMYESNKIFLEEIILYKGYDIKIIDKNNYWIIENFEEEELLEIIVILILKSDIIANNIANVNTTRTTEGGPYIRQRLIITPENGIEIIKDTKTDMQLRWDPYHPDAFTTGELKGYVRFPNVDIVIEKTDLQYITHLQNIFMEYLKLRYNILLL